VGTVAELPARNRADGSGGGGRKIPPHSLEAEEAVIGAVLLDSRSLDIVLEIIQPDDFYRDANRKIMRAAVDLHREDEPVDLVTLSEKLRGAGELAEIGGAQRLAEFAERVPTATHVAFYARQIREYSLRRQAIEHASEIVTRGFEISGPIAEYLPGLVAPLVDLPVKPRERAPLSETVVEVVTELERYQAGETHPAVSTGFADLDQVLSGGWHARYVVIGARTSVGKTALAFTSLLRIAQVGTSVAYISLEMSRSELTQRALSILSGVPLWVIVGGSISREDMTAVHLAAEELAELPLSIVDEDRDRSWHTVRMTIQRLVARGAGVVAVDYIGKLMLPENRKSRNEQITEISGGLAALTRRLKVPILAPSQVNREVAREKDKRPKLWMLRDSGSIEQDADDVLLLHRPAEYDTKADPSLCECIVAKQRQGPRKTVQLRWMPQTVSFEDWHEQSALFVDDGR
jgi:replicative DNA helicase